MTDANHKIDGSHVCARYKCSMVATIDTEMGAMCPAHSSPLLFEIQKPYDYRGKWRVPQYVPWEFMRPHDDQCLRNHGYQTLARLSERGGLSVKEALAVVLDSDWTGAIEALPRETAIDRFLAVLAAWEKDHGHVGHT